MAARAVAWVVGADKIISVKSMNPSLSLLERYAPLAPVNGCQSIVAYQAADIFGLWQAWEDECGTIRDVPYWAIVWPAAQVLAQYLVDNQSMVFGKSVLDCGCGGGVVGITAVANGARHATGCDMDQTAVFVAKQNADANALTIDFECLDVINCCDPKRFDLILVADLFYQKEFAAGLLAALIDAQRRGSEIIIADSGRPFLPKEHLIEIYCQSASTSFDVEGCHSRTVRLYRLP